MGADANPRMFLIPEGVVDFWSLARSLTDRRNFDDGSYGKT